MLMHKCTNCGKIFPITMAVRCPGMAFSVKGFGYIRHGSIDSYFMVKCPNCLNQEISNEIKLFGVFRYSVAKWAPGTVIVSILLLILILDHL